jgi:hypothetical protein
MALTVHFNYAGNWTALFCTGDKAPIPEELRGSTFVFKNSRGYDGQSYRYVAHDPFFEKGYASFVDDARLRYRRILVPGLAYALAFGSDNRIDATFIAVELATIFAGVFWSAAYLARDGMHPAWGLLFLLVPATLASIDRMVTDGPLAALFAGFLFFSATDRRAPAWCVACLAVLTRETGLILVAALVLHELWRKRYLSAGIAAAAAAPAFAWYLFVAVHTPPEMNASALVNHPVIGLVQRLFRVRHYASLPVLFQTLDVLAILGVIGSIAVAVHFIRGDGRLAPPDGNSRVRAADFSDVALRDAASRCSAHEMGFGSTLVGGAERGDLFRKSAAERDQGFARLVELVAASRVEGGIPFSCRSSRYFNWGARSLKI